MSPIADQSAQGEKPSDHYELIYSSKVEDFIPIAKYRSKRTGITVCLANVGGPTVSGFFCLATEVHDDDGLPHTLEHLIFLGSEDYPYKGVLDLCSNRCLASGTNAWTAVDHTSYTVTTAGSEGFLNFLPMYLDHILYPTLSDTGYTTEVHHVNGEGEDAGVVYCEMQGIENNGENLVLKAMLCEMYPGKCGYKCETGGILKNLRESTSNEKVRNYHRDFYRPDNLCVIITGQVEADDVFLALRSIDEKILAKGPRGDFVRPWQSVVPPFENDIKKTVPYPNDDELNGMVLVAWRGPLANDTSNVTSLGVLMLYLTDTSVSPLQRDFIEVEDNFCSQVSYSIEIQSVGYVELRFENVPKSKLEEIKPKLDKVLQRIASGEEELDMERMENVIQRKILTILSRLESNPHRFIAHLAIGDFLYGEGNEEFERQLNRVQYLEETKKFDASYWQSLLKSYFLDHKSATILGEPNCQLMTTMSDTEKERVEKQRELLGKSGLEARAAELENAIKTNDIPPPHEMISSVAVPDISKAKFHSIVRSSNYSDLAPDLNPLFPLESFPFRFQLDDLQSNFVSLHAIMDTSKIPQKNKLYLPLLLELAFESPIIRNGELVPHDAIVKELAKDTVDSAFALGIACQQLRFTCSDVAQMAHLYLQVDHNNYLTGVRWLSELLFCTRFTEERIKIVATKMAQDVSTTKRDGYFVVKSLINELSFAKDSNWHVNNLMRQHSFLTYVLKKVESDPAEVIAALESTRALLVNLDNLTIHLGTNVSKLFNRFGNLTDPWHKIFLSPVTATDGARKIGKIVVQSCDQLLLPFEDCRPSKFVAGVGSVESSFLIQYSPCNLSHTHPDVPVVFVLLQYLTQLEGPMWKQIRGVGLAYGADVNLDLSKRLIFVTLYRATHLVAAYEEAISILESHISGKTEWEQSLVESARSSLMYELVAKEKTVQSISILSLLSHLNALDANYNKNLIQSVAKVTIEDLNRVAPLYFPIVFDTVKSWIAVCCNPSKVEDITNGFKELSRDLAATTLESEFLNSFD